ncbi:MAG TPA: serine/threonine-protein kinase [Solirubrobacterales bacterium]|jgi:serine/threonine-protein kinase|nr:serine/threonine-protein kinase [Solirubrobacterales bacterium]
MSAAGHGIELSEGDEFAGYRIERRLGRGGMGVLYLALEPGLERRVALKLIAPEAAADEVFARRFAEESKIAASIEHPNVVPIYAAGEEAAVPFIAMRYVAGADLARRLAGEGRLEPAVAVELIAQVGNGLDAIHAAGLVHRDVKPANVLLSGGEGVEHAYITDFGVARNVSTESGLTQTGRFVGTLDYVAPEQISGGTIDARTDVYALGCLLFKLLTGEVPFPKDGEAARLFAHLNDPPPAPSLWVPEVSMALDDVVIRAMSKPPGDRFPSAGDLGRAAQAALRGEQTTAPERTVATGAAATRTAETIAVEPAEARAPDQETAATGRLAADTSPTAAQADRPAAPEAKGHGRRLILGGGGLIAVAIVAVAAALAGGGGGSSPSGASQDSKRPASKQKPKPPPKTLGKSELIAKADAICTDSKVTFIATRHEYPEGEFTPSVPYSSILAGISTRAVRKFNLLTPPASLSKPFGEYVKAQERVKSYDRQALKAAEAGDTAAYLAARESRNNEEAERYDLARAVGLEECSTNR